MRVKQTLLLVKPDAVERNYTGIIFQRVEQAGLSIDALRTVMPDADLIQRHYDEHTDEPYYPGLERYMTSGTVHVARLSGENAIERLQELAGETDPPEAKAGTIRGDLGEDSMEQADREDRAVENLVHAADPDRVERELALWFDRAAAAERPG